RRRHVAERRGQRAAARIRLAAARGVAGGAVADGGQVLAALDPRRIDQRDRIGLALDRRGRYALVAREIPPRCRADQQQDHQQADAASQPLHGFTSLWPITHQPGSGVVCAAAGCGCMSAAGAWLASHADTAAISDSRMRLATTPMQYGPSAARVCVRHDTSWLLM